MKLRIDYAICNSCGLCREVCPEGAIRPALLEPRHLYEVQPAKCTGAANVSTIARPPALWSSISRRLRSISASARD